MPTAAPTRTLSPDELDRIQTELDYIANKTSNPRIRFHRLLDLLPLLLHLLAEAHAWRRHWKATRQFIPPGYDYASALPYLRQEAQPPSGVNANPTGKAAQGKTS